MDPERLPGSEGEHELQERHGTRGRALAFYRNQVLDRLTPEMREFVAAQEMLFVGTADAHGECDCSFRFGPAGFVRSLDDRHVAWPDFRGNGVLASLGNILENPHVGLILVDFFRATIGLHVNGKARVVELAEAAGWTGLSTTTAEDGVPGPRPERWVVVEVEEAYVHCSKHIPRLARLEKEIAWGTDDVRKKGGDFFAARGLPRPWNPSALPPR